MHIQDDFNDNLAREMYNTWINTKWDVINDGVDGVEADCESAERESVVAVIVLSAAGWIAMAQAAGAPAVLRRADGDIMWCCY